MASETTVASIKNYTLNEFFKFQHLERLGTKNVEGILDGVCEIYPKLDGTNSSVWTKDNTIKAGSRKRELTTENDNAGFCKWVYGQKNLKEFAKYTLDKKWKKECLWILCLDCMMIF